MNNWMRGWKRVTERMNPSINSFEQAFAVEDITSPAMREAIREWYALYYGTLNEPAADGCQRLAYTIVDKLQKVVFAEYTSQLLAERKDLEQAMEALNRVKRQAMQQLLVGGEILLKPVPQAGGFGWMVIPRWNFIPLARNEEGRLTAVGTIAVSSVPEDAGAVYRLLERRSVNRDGLLTVENRLYRASSPQAGFGVPVPLDTLPEYGTLPESYTYSEPLYGLGMVELKTPILNCVDGSREGVAVYAAASELIRRVARNEQQMNDEFENGASRILVSADLLTVSRDSMGNVKKRLKDKLFTALDEAPEEVPITIFAPQLREESYLNRKKEYLRSIETVIGLQRGTLSEVEQQARTATELTNTKREYALTALGLQQVWEDGLRRCMALADSMGRMYGLTGSKSIDVRREIAVDWGNGILYDEEKDWKQMIEMEQTGILRPEILLAWKYNLPWKNEADLEKIRSRYMPDGKEA